MKSLKIIILCGLGGAVLFGVFSLIFYFGDWERLGIVTAFGAFVGLVGAPEFEPRAFKHAWAFQSSCGCIGGVLAGMALGLAGVDLVYTAIIGAALGWSAPYWIKHAPIP